MHSIENMFYSVAVRQGPGTREDGMRSWDEPVEVRRGRIGEGVAGVGELGEGPAQFLWRNRLWRVLDVHARWVESGPWWDGPAARAARGEQPAGTSPDPFEALAGPSAVSPGDVEGPDDLLCEQEVWRIEAASGMRFSRGVYELANALADDTWRLRAVVD